MKLSFSYPSSIQIIDYSFERLSTTIWPLIRIVPPAQLTVTPTRIPVAIEYSLLVRHDSPIHSHAWLTSLGSSRASLSAHSRSPLGIPTMKCQCKRPTKRLQGSHTTAAVFRVIRHGALSSARMRSLSCDGLYKPFMRDRWQAKSTSFASSCRCSSSTLDLNHGPQLSRPRGSLAPPLSRSRPASTMLSPY